MHSTTHFLVRNEYLNAANRASHPEDTPLPPQDCDEDRPRKQVKSTLDASTSKVLRQQMRFILMFSKDFECAFRCVSFHS